MRLFFKSCIWYTSIRVEEALLRSVSCSLIKFLSFLKCGCRLGFPRWWSSLLSLERRWHNKITAYITSQHIFFIIDFTTIIWRCYRWAGALTISIAMLEKKMSRLLSTESDAFLRLRVGGKTLLNCLRVCLCAWRHRFS